MKKTGIRVGLLCLALLVSMTAFAGCSELLGGESSKEEETLYPVSVNGREIRVGETTMQTLLDAGYEVTVSEWTEDHSDIEEYEVDPEQLLDADSYYSGGSVWLSESSFAHVSFVTNETPVKLSGAVIARMEFNLGAEESTDLLEKLQINGVPVTEITREKAEEMFPDFTGNEGMWLKYGLDYKYDLNFDSATGRLMKFSVERSYDVDYTED